MEATTQIKLFQVFKVQFGEANAEKIVSIIEDTIDAKIEAKKDVLLTTTDKLELIKELKDVRLEIARAKVDTIKWVFAFFLTLALMIAGLYIRK